jgi:hypothetical protein
MANTEHHPQQTVERFDFTDVVSYEETPEGFLRVRGRVARTGVQNYQNPDGTIRREYRPLSEVGDPEALASFSLLPVTFLHPPVKVTAENRNQYSKGTTGETAVFRNPFVEVLIQVEDADTIRSIREDDITQLSSGYNSVLEMIPGVSPEGERYDCIQRRIRGNHVAIVPKGRAGPEVRLLLDHIDATAAVACSQPPAIEQLMSTATVLLDDVSVDLPTDAAAVVAGFVRSTQRDLDDLTTHNDSLTADLLELQEKLAALTGDGDNLHTDAEEEYEDKDDDKDDDKVVNENGDELVQIDAADLDELLAYRLDTIEHLAPAFPEDFVFDSLDEDELYAEAFVNLTDSDIPENADPAYISGVVDGILSTFSDDEEGEDEDDEEGDFEKDADHQDAVGSTQRLRSAVQRSRYDAADNVPSGRGAYRADLRAAWQQPLGMHK